MDLSLLVAKMKTIPLKELEEISVKAGVPYGTTLKIRGGFTKNPRINTVAALEPFFIEETKATQ